MMSICFGMDRHLAAKAKPAGAAAVAAEAVHVIQISKDGVDGLGPGRGGSERNLSAGEQQLLTVGRPLDAKACREILGAEQQRRDRRVGRGDVARAEDRRWRFKQQQQRWNGAAGRVTPEHTRDELHQTDGFDLRQQHTIEAGAAGEKLQISFSVGRMNAVESHQPQRPG